MRELVPGLFIAGFGGSLPTLFKPEGSNDFEEVFTAYPYLTEAAYSEDLTSLWDKVVP